jgi:hypothetical protein
VFAQVTHVGVSMIGVAPGTNVAAR